MPESEQDLIRKADAGAQLVYAMYHAPADWWNNKAPMPTSVHLAYMRACQAHRISKNALEETPWEREDLNPHPPT